MKNIGLLILVFGGILFVKAVSAQNLDIKKIDSIKQLFDKKLSSIKQTGVFDSSEVDVYFKGTTNDWQDISMKIKTLKEVENYTHGSAFYYKFKGSDNSIKMICYDSDSKNDISPQYYIDCYYFDNQGKTICYSRHSNDCVNGEQKETRYFNSSGKQIKSKCIQINKKGVKSEKPCPVNSIERNVNEVDSVYIFRYGFNFK